MLTLLYENIENLRGKIKVMVKFIIIVHIENEKGQELGTKQT